MSEEQVCETMLLFSTLADLKSFFSDFSRLENDRTFPHSAGTMGMEKTKHVLISATYLSRAAQQEGALPCCQATAEIECQRQLTCDEIMA